MSNRHLGLVAKVHQDGLTEQISPVRYIAGTLRHDVNGKDAKVTFCGGI